MAHIRQLTDGGSSPPPATHFFPLGASERVFLLMYIVYVLHSKRYDKIYIGYTSNLQDRIISHNEKATKGWTIKYRPWKLIHSEGYKTKEEALNREKELKSSRGRDFIKTQILNK